MPPSHHKHLGTPAQARAESGSKSPQKKERKHRHASAMIVDAMSRDVPQVMNYRLNLGNCK